MAPDITQVIEAVERGDESAAAELLPLVYAELRRLAAQRLGQERPGQTLQATALVHEAYLRLLGPEGGEAVGWRSRGHFFAAAAEAMRRLLIERARAKGALKRGGQRRRLVLSADALVIAGVVSPLQSSCSALSNSTIPGTQPSRDAAMTPSQPNGRQG